MRNVIVLIGLTMLLALSGCDEEERIPRPRGTHVEKPITSGYKNAAGQVVECVAAKEFSQWLSGHTNVRIVSIAAVSNTMSNANPTTEFWVVYEAISQ